MRLALIILGAGLVAAAGLLTLAFYYRTEHYKIVHEAFIPGSAMDVLKEGPTVCYSNEQLRKAVTKSNYLHDAGMEAYDLDKENLIACVITNYVVEEAHGWKNLGVITVHKSPTNGVSFTVIRGTKRFLQFNNLSAQKPK